MSTSVELKYRAFLSYAHADVREAKRLHGQLESFRIDNDLAGRVTPLGPVPKTLRPIFRDREDFSGGHTLTDATLAALDQSAALIVLCSKVAATRPAVNEEVRLFRHRHPDRPVIPVILDGSWPDNFPPALRFELDSDGSITDRPMTVLGPDLRDDADGRSLGLAKVVAGLVGVGTDEIVRRAEREKRRRMRNWIAGLSAVVVALAGLTVWAEFNRREAVEQRTAAEANLQEAQISQSRQLSEAARVISDQPGGGDTPLAMLLALEGMPDSANDDPLMAMRPKVEEAQLQLDRAYRGNHERSVLVHDSAVLAVAWSSDGRYLATASGDMARIIEAATGKHLGFFAQEGKVNAVAWSPDGRHLAVALRKENQAGEARIIDAVTGRDVNRVFHRAEVRSVAWSPDGRQLASGSGAFDKKGEVRVIEAATGNEVVRFARDGSVYAVAWSPDGSHLAIGFASGLYVKKGEAQIIEIATGKQTVSVRRDSVVSALAWSPDGLLLATGWGFLNQGGETQIIEAASGKEIVQVVHSNPTKAVAWSPDGRLLATALGYQHVGEALIVEATTGKQVARFADAGEVLAVAWSPYGKLLATGLRKQDNRGEVRILAATADKEIHQLKTGDHGRVVAWSPDGQHIATGSWSDAQIVEIATGRRIVSIRHAGNVYAIAWSPDGRLLATGSRTEDRSGEARIIEVATGREVVRIPHGGEVRAVAWSPDGKLLASGASGAFDARWGEARIFDARNGREIRRLEHENKVGAVAWSPDGRLLATGSGNVARGEVKIIVVATGDELARIPHLKWSRKLTWSPDGHYIATASLDTKIAQVFEAVTGKEVLRFVHDNWVNAIEWSPDGQYVVVGGADKSSGGEAWIIRRETGKKIARLVHDRPVHGVAWSLPGTAVDPAILTMTDDGTARIWLVWPNAQVLVDSAKSRAARCLTPAQRVQYFLPPAPPTWCVTRRLWPYQSDEWQAWLPKQRAWLAGGRLGSAPELPKSE